MGPLVALSLWVWALRSTDISGMTDLGLVSVLPATYVAALAVIVVGFVASLFLEPGWRSSLIGLVAGGGVLWLVAEAYFRLRHVEGLGFGDGKMLAMIGAFLGWPLMLLTLVIASMLGAVVGIALMATRRGDMQSALPFGTFLAVAAVGAGLWGTPIVDWYASFYR